MRISVQADEGDEVSICADFISVEQAIVTLEIENTFYNSQTELESVRCRPETGWNLGSAISGNMRLWFQAARSIG